MPDSNSKPPKKIRLPMLPMRDIVVFPHMTAPFFIGRPLSIAALEEALSKDRKIFVVAQEAVSYTHLTLPTNREV